MTIESVAILTGFALFVIMVMFVLVARRLEKIEDWIKKHETDHDYHDNFK